MNGEAGLTKQAFTVIEKSQIGSKCRKFPILFVMWYFSSS